MTPKELTDALVGASLLQGATIRMGRVTEVVTEAADSGTMQAVAVMIDGERLDAKTVVIAMGPWSVQAAEWFPDLRVPMEGIWSTSLVFEPGQHVDGYALFCGEDTHGCHTEVYPRPDHTVYVCGCGGSRHVPGHEIRCVLCMYDILQSSKSASSTQHTRGKYRQTG